MKSSTLQALCDHARETARLASIDALLQWDERTLMPPAAGDYRAEQIALLARMVHARRTDPQVGRWLDELEETVGQEPPHSSPATTVRWMRREYSKQTRLPASLVEALSRACTKGQQVWVEARSAQSFAQFQPYLEQLVELKQQEAAALGYEDDIYDALLDDYEPYGKTSDVAHTLAELRTELVPLVQQIVGSSRRAPIGAVRGEFPEALQAEFGTAMATAIGFEFPRGRLDVTAHPFCSTMGPHDCRITTRYDQSYFPSAFYGILHEAGHGIYEQGLPPEQFGLPPGNAVSLGIHESQSRMWENQVGRSMAFWKYAYPQAQAVFGPSLTAPLDQVYFAMNHVEPSLIRVEADEVTYNLHIIIRFELERELLAGDLAVRDLPAAWRQKYLHYLGIEPRHDGEGVLQDIHWSAGLFGYFPTYSLGNLYAAQFFEQAQLDIPDMLQQFAVGEFRPLREWLRSHIHQHGQCYLPAELVERVTGRPLSHEPLMRYLRTKLAPLYGFTP